MFSVDKVLNDLPSVLQPGVEQLLGTTAIRLWFHFDWRRYQVEAFAACTRCGQRLGAIVPQPFVTIDRSVAEDALPPQQPAVAVSSVPTDGRHIHRHEVEVEREQAAADRTRAFLVSALATRIRASMCSCVADAVARKERARG